MFADDTILVQLYEAAITGPLKIEPVLNLPNPINIPGFSSKTIAISFKPPTGLNASAIPIYSGKVTISGTNGDRLGIPYLGE